MAIVAGLFAGLFGRLLGRRRGALASLAAIGLYTLLEGASAPVVRAALMSGLSVFAAQVGRRQDGLNTLAFVAALMALFNPQVLWDVGFQLSFLATLGLVLYVGPLTEAFTGLLARRLPPERAQRLAAGDKRNLPDPETLAAVEGYTLTVEGDYWTWESASSDIQALQELAESMA